MKRYVRRGKEEARKLFEMYSKQDKAIPQFFEVRWEVLHIEKTRKRVLS